MVVGEVNNYCSFFRQTECVASPPYNPGPVCTRCDRTQRGRTGCALTGPTERAPIPRDKSKQVGKYFILFSGWLNARPEKARRRKKRRQAHSREAKQPPTCVHDTGRKIYFVFWVRARYKSRWINGIATGAPKVESRGKRSTRNSNI